MNPPQQMLKHVRPWIEAGLRTGPADRGLFEAAARACYQHAGLPWHGRVIWVSSPLALAYAVSLMPFLLWAQRTGSSLEGPQEGLPVCPEGGHSVENEITYATRTVVHQAIFRTVVPHEYAETRACFTHALDAAVQTPLVEPVAEAVHASIDHALSQHVNPGLVRSLQESLGVQVSARLIEQALRWDALRGLQGRLDGQFRPADAHGGAALTSYFREVRQLELPGDLWERSRAFEQTVQTACWWYPSRELLLACERPSEIHLQASQLSEDWQPGAIIVTAQLHRRDRPAISWPDGWGSYFISGRRLPAWLSDDPGAITPARIEAETNTELRRAMLQIYGWSRYIAATGAEIIDSIPLDHAIAGLRGARLLRKTLPGEPEPIVFLEMRNSTPEPDGTHRRYLERIDPNVYDGDAGRFCHAAMASRWFYRDASGELTRTFEDWQDYQPALES